jgi:hypothetical protein
MAVMNFHFLTIRLAYIEAWLTVMTVRDRYGCCSK